MAKQEKKKTLELPGQVWVGWEEYANDDPTLSVDQRPDPFAEIGVTKLIGRYALVEVLAVRGEVKCGHHAVGPHPEHDPTRR